MNLMKTLHIVLVLSFIFPNSSFALQQVVPQEGVPTLDSPEQVMEALQETGVEDVSLETIEKTMQESQERLSEIVVSTEMSDVEAELALMKLEKERLEVEKKLGLRSKRKLFKIG